MHKFADNVREGSTSTGTGNFVTTGGSTALPLPTVGRTLDDTLSVGDTFDYVIQDTTASAWEVGKGTYLGTNTFSRDRVVASSNAGGKVNFGTGPKLVWNAPTSEIRNHFADIENIVNSGAVNGSDNTTAIAAARTAAGANKPVIAPYGSSVWGIKQSTLADFSQDTKGEGSALSFSQGTAANPSTRSNPLLYLEKFSNGDGVSNDHGLLDFRFKKVGGSASIYSYGAYIAAENAGGSGGRVAPLAVLLKSSNSGAVNDVAAVFYAEKSVSMTTGLVTAVEVDINDSSGQDNGWKDNFSYNSTVGISLTNAVGRGTIGIKIATATPGNGFYTGMLFDTDSILPNTTDVSGNAEAIRVKGGSTSGTKYTGFWCQSGYMKQAINLVGPTYNSGVMMLAPKDNYISFGTADTSTSRIKWKSSTDTFDIEGNGLSVSGTQVIGPRITGWTAASGVGTKGGFNSASVDVATLAESVKQLIDDLITHGVIGT